MKKSNILIGQLEAVSVTGGPGSYTGLRVGMAGAKGICYALKIPLITISTLEVMALAVIKITDEPGSFLYCPMIDARRLEVFTALFDNNLNEIIPPCNLILKPESFHEFLMTRQVIFCGTGAKKFINLSEQGGLFYEGNRNTANAMASLSFRKFLQKNFADLLYAEPEYLKQFYSM